MKKKIITPESTAKEVLRLRIEINGIKRFMYALENDGCRPSSKIYSFIRVKRSFIGLFTIHSVDLPIPDKLNIEIAAKCTVWIDELERRIEDLIPSQKK